MIDPKSAAGYRLGIVNPLTLVGTEIQSILRERSFPFARVVLLDSTGQATGALTEIGEEPAIVLAVSDDELEDCDVVFFCGPAEGNQEWIQRYDEDNFVAIDLSQPSSAAEGKLAVSGVNLEEIGGDDRLLVSPHPVAIPIAIILRQLEILGRVEMCAATVVQPASVFEQAGIEELARQTISVLNIQSMPHEVFDRQLAFNLYPAPERNEELITSQIRSLTDPDTQLALLVTQGTIFHSHTYSLFVKTKEDFDVDRITASLRANAAIAFAEGDQAFGTIDAAGKDEVLIAEVRPDASIRGGFWVWAVCDNLRRSSALNAVLVAEKVLFGSEITN
ncbi:MAG TPA: Asd/ArgC dimerization domain-containing protein [Thermoanaerobaculia bacterium]|jgi:aspartate-semialdehyde dehydrogenase|nr:Asd/ArgC dimerization domain-containing protein [Thermoanaerobaculia bacterium]